MESAGAGAHWAARRRDFLSIEDAVGGKADSRGTAHSFSSLVLFSGPLCLLDWEHNQVPATESPQRGPFLSAPRSLLVTSTMY